VTLSRQFEIMDFKSIMVHLFGSFLVNK
jgi:hypothetical protein